MRRHCMFLLALAMSIETCIAAPPKIFSTVANFSTNQIGITGKNFSPTGIAPTVTLAPRRRTGTETESNDHFEGFHPPAYGRARWNRFLHG
jgi:hypothetical protein